VLFSSWIFFFHYTIHRRLSNWSIDIEHITAVAFREHLYFWCVLSCTWINRLRTSPSDIFRHDFHHEFLVFRPYNKELFIWYLVFELIWSLINMSQSLLNLVRPYCLRGFIKGLHVKTGLDNRRGMICVDFKITLRLQNRSS